MFILLTLALLVIVVVYVSKTYSLTRRIENLEWDGTKIKRLDERLAVLERTISQPATTPEAKTLRQVETERTAVAPPSGSIDKREIQPAKALADGKPLILQPVYEKEPKPSRTREEWEAFVGGKLLNRIGAFALILGIGFFLKYAFDRDWISELVRVLIGVASGLLCLAAAYRTHTRQFKIFAQGLVGAGIAILYLSIFAAFNFYSLVPQWAAFGLMSIVTVIALTHAFYYDSLAVALLAWAGGFLTPIMLSTGHPNEAGLFTYLALLNLGLLATLLRKESWNILEPLSFFATWSIYLSWRGEYYQAQDLPLTIFFISVFWLLFYGLDAFRLGRGLMRSTALFQVVGVMNALLFFSSLYVVINKDHHDLMGLVTVAVGGIYFLTATLIERRTPLEPMFKAHFLVSSFVLLAVATAIQFEGFTTVMVWSLEAVVLVWYGLLEDIQYAWQCGIGLFFVCAVKLATTDGAFQFAPIQDFRLLANRRALTLAVMTATTGLGGWLTLRFKQEQREALDSARDILNFSWCAWLFLLLTAETSDYFRQRMLDQPPAAVDVLSFARLMTLAVVWVTASLPLAWLATRKNLLPVAIAGIGLLFFGVLLSASRGLVFDPISAFKPLFNLRAAAVVLILALMIFHERVLRGSTQAWGWMPTILNILRVSIALSLLLLFTAEARDFFELRIANESLANAPAETLDRLRNLQQLSLSGVWLLYSVGLMALGIWRSLRGFRIVAFVLFGLTILKIFIYDLSFLETLYRIFSFMGLGLILLAVSYAYQRYKNEIFGTAQHSGQ